MYYQDQAIVLKRVNFRDDDLLVTFLTSKYGKITAQAKSAKKIKSKLAGHLEPMSRVDIEWVQGRAGEKLIGSQMLESYRNIKDDYEKVRLGFYFLEIIDKALKFYHAEKSVFQFLKNVLDRLNAMGATDGLSIVKLCFDYKLLYLLGYHAEERIQAGESKGVVDLIINSSVDEMVNKNLNQRIVMSLNQQADGFLEEVVEEKIYSIST